MFLIVLRWLQALLYDFTFTMPWLSDTFLHKGNSDSKIQPVVSIPKKSYSPINSFSLPIEVTLTFGNYHQDRFSLARHPHGNYLVYHPRVYWLTFSFQCWLRSSLHSKISQHSCSGRYLFMINIPAHTFCKITTSVSSVSSSLGNSSYPFRWPRWALTPSKFTVPSAFFIEDIFGVDRLDRLDWAKLRVWICRNKRMDASSTRVARRAFK